MKAFTTDFEGVRSMTLLDPIALADSREQLIALVADLHVTNGRLWDAEDVARCRSGYTVLALAKRSIDRLNMQRNGLIEQIDGVISAGLDKLSAAETQPAVHTETIGSVIDRLVILAIRLSRTRAASRDEPALSSRIAHLEDQYSELESALKTLVEEVAAGSRRLPDGRRFKLYGRQQAAALVAEDRSTSIS